MAEGPRCGCLSDTAASVAQAEPAANTCPRCGNADRPTRARCRDGKCRATSQIETEATTDADAGESESSVVPAPLEAQSDAERFARDRDTFHMLLDHRDKIRRTVNHLEDGIDTLTETDDSELRKVLVQHVQSMYDRVEHGNPIRMRDPLFAAVFRNSGKIQMKLELTEKGVRVVEMSSDPNVARLIQAHAEVVNLFLKQGHAEARRNHEVPAKVETSR
jgi:hypothetical protein